MGKSDGSCEKIKYVCMVVPYTLAMRTVLCSDLRLVDRDSNKGIANGVRQMTSLFLLQVCCALEKMAQDHVLKTGVNLGINFICRRQ